MASGTEKTPRRAYTAATLYKNIRHFVDDEWGTGDVIPSDVSLERLLDALEARIVFEETGYTGT